MKSAIIEAGAGPVSNEVTARDWFTAAELADMRLPGLPSDKRAVNRRAREERWLYRVDGSGLALARPREGRGGGVEFHVSLLPGAARIDLARRGLSETRPSPAEPDAAASGSWRWYDLQTEKTKAVAQERLTIVKEIALLKDSGITLTVAVAEASRRHEKGASTLWSWIKLIEGVAPRDWLPALAPHRKGGGAEVDIDPELWAIFKRDFLRPSMPTLASCYARTAEIAATRGLSLPCERTMRRRLEADIDPRVITYLRKGEEALRRSIPANRRSVEGMHALECVNIDGHVFDVRVIPPGGGKPIRPVMVGIQDVYSSKVLAWRVGETESAALARLAFADLFRDYGIPLHAVLDNGRGFASKWLTGAAANRYRFKVKPEDPTGVLVALNIGIHWALPYRGQSKPIERAWRDLCDTCSRHPATEGAYLGNNVLNKPHNYGERAMEWAEFVAHVERSIAFHNRKLGRKGRHYRGRSFDDVFSESYANSPMIGKAQPEQLRMALLAAEQKRVNRQTGCIELYGNRYWTELGSRLHGQLLTVRFDPENLHQEIHLYGQDGGYLTSAELIEDTGFLDVAGAKATAKRWADVRRKTREAVEAEQLLTVEEVARQQVDAPFPQLPEPIVLRPVRHRGQTAAALKPLPAPDAESRTARENRVFEALRLVGPAE